MEAMPASDKAKAFVFKLRKKSGLSSAHFGYDGSLGPILLPRPLDCCLTL